MDQSNYFNIEDEASAVLVYSVIRETGSFPDEAHEQTVYAGTDKDYAFSFIPNGIWDSTVIYIFNGQQLIQIHRADKGKKWELIFNLNGQATTDGEWLYNEYYLKALNGEKC